MDWGVIVAACITVIATLFLWATDRLFRRLDHLDGCLDRVQTDVAYIKGILLTHTESETDGDS